MATAAALQTLEQREAALAARERALATGEKEAALTAREQALQAREQHAKHNTRIETNLAQGRWMAQLLIMAVAAALLTLTAAGGFTGVYKDPTIEALAELKHGFTKAGVPRGIPRFFEGYDWLSSNWMFIHAGLGILVLPMLHATKKPQCLDWLSMLLVCCYLLKQFEEHAWDARGRRYPSIHHVTGLVGCSVAMEDVRRAQPYIKASSGCGIDENTILWINVYGVLGAMVLPLLLPARFKAFAVLYNAMAVAANAVIFHLGVALVRREYNPGLIWAVLINAPMALWVMHALQRSAAVSTRQVAIAFLLVGVAGHPLRAVTPMLAMRKGMVTHDQQHAALFCMMFVVPAFTMLCSARIEKKKGE